MLVRRSNGPILCHRQAGCQSPRRTHFSPRPMEDIMNASCDPQKHKAVTGGRATQSRDRRRRGTKPRPAVAPHKAATGGGAAQSRDRRSRHTKPRPVVAPNQPTSIIPQQGTRPWNANRTKTASGAAARTTLVRAKASAAIASRIISSPGNSPAVASRWKGRRSTIDRSSISPGWSRREASNKSAACGFAARTQPCSRRDHRSRLYGARPPVAALWGATTGCGFMGRDHRLRLFARRPPTPRRG